LISQNLFRETVQRGYPFVQLAGLDVEKPDLIDLSEIEAVITQEIYAPQPVVEIAKCRFCGVCSNYCVRKAIQFNRFVPSVTLIVSRCCACGNCQKACNRNGIQMKEKHIGKIIRGSISQHQFIAGELDPDCEFQLPLIKDLLKNLDPEAICICDFGPGAGLPVTIALEEMDVAIIVLQNHPDWRLHLDEMIAITTNNVRLTGLVINKIENDSTYTSEIKEYCSIKSIPFWGSIPYFSEFKTNTGFDGKLTSMWPLLPVSGILDAIINSHKHFQSSYNETFTQH